MHSRTAKPTPQRFAGAVSGKRCPICLNRVEIQSAAEIIPCKHVYCVGCIRKWSNVKRNCPLCNANFTSWFRTSDHSTSLREEKLPPSDRGKQVSLVSRRDDDALRRWRAQLFDRRRLIGVTRRAFNRQSQANVLPRQRTFIRETGENPDVVAERVKRWRARLQAVPSGSKNSLVQQIVGNTGAEEPLLRRIEPWIRRELQAVLGDPDPTVIVHVVTSLFIYLHKKKNENFPREGAQSDFLAPLRPFLHEQAELFWHELRSSVRSMDDTLQLGLIPQNVERSGIGFGTLCPRTRGIVTEA